MLLVVSNKTLRRTPSQDLNYDHIYSMGMYFSIDLHIFEELYQSCVSIFLMLTEH